MRLTPCFLLDRPGLFPAVGEDKDDKVGELRGQRGQVGGFRFVYPIHIYRNCAGDDKNDSVSQICSSARVRAFKSALKVADQLILEEGPDHARRFTVSVSLQDGRCARGEGSSKKQAEQAAAAAMLSELKELSDA